MKRSWFGFFLLTALLLAGALVTRVMVKIHGPEEALLQQAAAFAMENDWTQAESSFRQAQDSWNAWEHLRSCFADHDPVEKIDADFESLDILCTVRDRIAFAGGCRSLARQVAAVGEAHQLVWKNLL